MHIDLDAKLRELDRVKNPATLTLRGRTYTFLPAFPPEAVIRLSAAPERNEDEEVWRVAIIDFIAACLIDDDQDDWLDATQDREAFPNELIDECIVQLAREFLARPTSPSTDSAPGPGASGRTSSSQPSQTASATSAA